MSYMVINVTTLEATMVLTVADSVRAALWGRIYKAKGSDVIGPPLEGRGFSKLTLEQLQYLYWNLTQQPPSGEFAELVQKLVEVVKTIKEDDTPIATLEAEVKQLYPDDSLTPAAPKAEKKVREPRVPGEAPERPKATSTTGLVWELADQQFGILHPSGDASTADWKFIRAGVMDACETEGINSATAATQYSKWKAAKLAVKGS